MLIVIHIRGLTLDHMLLAAAGCAANADVSCGSDYEGGDHSRLVGVAPSQVYISHNAVAVQVSAGLQFTGKFLSGT